MNPEHSKFRSTTYMINESLHDLEGKTIVAVFGDPILQNL